MQMSKSVSGAAIAAAAALLFSAGSFTTASADESQGPLRRRQFV